MRVRPAVAREMSTSGSVIAVEVHGDNTAVAHFKDEEKRFAFDKVFDPSTSQSNLFASVMSLPLQKFVTGINICIFCCK